MPRKAMAKNSIFISKGRTERYRNISSNSKFFWEGEYFIIKETETSLKIERASIDYIGKTQKAVRGKSGWVFFQFVSNLPIGEFKLDEEEIEEDYVIIYYKEQTQ